VPREQRHVGQDVSQLGAEREERRRGPAHVRDREVEHAVAAEHRPPEQLAEQRRREAGQVDQRLAAKRLVAPLERFGALEHATVAGQRIRLGYRQLDEQGREDIAQRVLVLVGPDVDRDLGSQPGCRRRLVTREEQVAQGARGECEHYVVDRAAKRALERHDVVEREAHGAEASARAQRSVEAAVRRGDELLSEDKVRDGRRARERVAGVQQRVRTGLRAVNEELRV